MDGSMNGAPLAPLAQAMGAPLASVTGVPLAPAVGEMLWNGPRVGEDVEKPANPFKPAIKDFVFALIIFVLGYLFSCWVFFTQRGWGVAAFTTAYVLTVNIYLALKGAYRPCAATFFWMAVTWATGLSYALWDNAGFTHIRILFLFCAAVYYAIVASGRMFSGKTSNFLPVDGLNAVVLIPFRNISNQYVSFKAISKKEKPGGKRSSVVLGLVFAVILLVCLIPMLERADSGGFRRILNTVTDLFNMSQLLEFLFYLVFAIPFAAYIYGLVSGAAHNRNVDTIQPEQAGKAAAALRFLQPASVFISLGAICGLYIVFILCQTPYFFSALMGRIPDGWMNYAEYARQGFFELCAIVVINLIAITVSNVTCKKLRTESIVLKVFNIVLSVITLVLIATAFSKMALYISVYGLTMPRLLPCVFMVFMAAVFIALIALQKWDFSIVRFALVTGSVIFCILCLSNPDALVVRYNTDRYLSGTLEEYDTEVLYRAGNAGVAPAFELYRSTQDMQLKGELRDYLESQVRQDNGMQNNWGRGANTYSLESYRAQELLR